MRTIRLQAATLAGRKRNKKTAPWSPALAQQYLLIQYWLTCKWAKEKNGDYRHLIDTIRNQITVEATFLSDNIEEIQRELIKAKMKCKEC